MVVDINGEDFNLDLELGDMGRNYAYLDAPCCITPDISCLFVEGEELKILVPLSRRLKCHVCEYDCAGKESSGAVSNTLSRHLFSKHKIWAKKLPYRCRFCGYENPINLFYSRKYLEDHIKAHHANCTTAPEELLPFPCIAPDCGQSFSSKRGLAMHGKVHTREKVQFVKNDLLALVPLVKKKANLYSEIKLQTPISPTQITETAVSVKDEIELQANVGFEPEAELFTVLAEREELNEDRLNRIKNKYGWLDDCCIFECLITRIMENKPNFLVVNPVVWNEGYVPTYWDARRKAGRRLPTLPRYSNSWKVAFIPANVNGNHWILGVLTKRTRSLVIFDTMRNPLDGSVKEKMRCIGELLTKKLPRIHEADSNSYFVQQDGCSCGPSVCMLAERIAVGKPTNFMTKEVYEWRDEVYNFLTKKLTDAANQPPIPKNSHIVNSIKEVITAPPAVPIDSELPAEKRELGGENEPKGKNYKKRLNIGEWAVNVVNEWRSLNATWSDFEEICRAFSRIVATTVKGKKDKAELIADSTLSSLSSNYSSEIAKRTVATQTEPALFRRRGAQRKCSAPTPLPVHRLYLTNKKSAINTILNPDTARCELPLEVVEKYFQKVSSRKSIDFHGDFAKLMDALPEPGEAYEEKEVCRPITESEVALLFRRAKRSAPGWDRISYANLKQVDPSFRALTSFFNVCLATERVPEDWKLSQTVLIHKKGNPTDLANWRPISLQITIYKIFSALLSNRISALPNLISREQKGFNKFDGCAENIQKLSSAINDAKLSRKSIAIAFLDLSNAFGSVPHQVIFEMMEKLGLPGKLVNLTKNIYSGSLMTVKTGKGQTRPISMEAGVKQGDPLSPILFNIALELLLRLTSAKFLQYGYKMGTLKVNVLAYADDLAVVTTDEKKLQHQLDNMCHVARIMGLRFNPAKCATLCLKEHVAVIDTKLNLAETPLKSLSWDEHYKYLGFEVGAILRRSPKSQIIQSVKDILAIKESGLMPAQKIDAFRTFIMPRFAFICENSAPYVSDFQSLDRAIAIATKEICNLPIFGASRLYLNSSISKGGLGILRSVDEYYLHAVAKAFRSLTNNDEELRTLAQSELERMVRRWTGYCPTLRDLGGFLGSQELRNAQTFDVLARQAGENSSPFTRFRRAIKHFGAISINVSIEFDMLEAGDIEPLLRVSCERLGKHLIFNRYNSHLVYSLLREMLMDMNSHKLSSEYEYQGSLLKIISANHLNNKFVQDCHFCPANVFRFVHRARLGLVPLGSTPMGRHLQLEVLCRRCFAEKESLSHVLCSCTHSRGLVVARHDAILQLIVEEFRCLKRKNNTKNGFKNGANCLDLEIEPSIWAEGSLYKPDLIITDKTRKIVRVIDVACVNEANAGLLNARARKCAIYEPVRLHFESHGFECCVLPVIVGCLGVWDVQNNIALTEMGFPNGRKTYIARKSIEISLVESRQIFYSHCAV